MKSLSDSPVMAWSRPPVEIPWAVRNFLLNTGTHEVELEMVATDLLSRYDGISELIADQF
jgi:hypothetical protein